MSRKLRLAAGVIAAAGILSSGSLAAAPQVWFAPTDNLPRGAKTFDRDFPELFEDPPTWDTRINVFQIAPYYAARATDRELLRVADFLSRHGIALAVGAHSVQVDGECSLGEGLIHPRQNLTIFRRLKKLGLKVKYVGLDEPLTFGHYFARGKRACLLPIKDVARRVAATIAEIRQSYPDARFVDYEAPGVAPITTWPADLAEWLAAYEASTGTPLDAVVFDADWRKPWLSWVRPGADIVHRRGVRAGMFLTIAGPGRSDQEAVADLKSNIRAVRAAGLPLDLVIIACWTPYPSHSVPASDPNSLTAVLDWYLQSDSGG